LSNNNESTTGIFPPNISELRTLDGSKSKNRICWVHNEHDEEEEGEGVVAFTSR
jgi:hypothetical protein